MTSPVTYELDGDVALVGLNRPDKRNALNDEMIGLLADAFRRAEREAGAGVVFGHGPNFSSGLDLREMADRMAGDTGERRRTRHHWHEAFDIMARGSVPFVAAVSGAVVGGGLELAAAAHIRVADRTAYFCLPEASRGIFVGGGGAVRIQRLIGTAPMMDMMLTGRALDVDEAQQLRLVQYVEPDDAFARAKTLAARIARNPRNSNWAITHLLPRINDMSHDDGLFVELLAALAVPTDESTERLAAFLEKRADRVRSPSDKN